MKSLHIHIIVNLFLCFGIFFELRAQDLTAIIIEPTCINSLDGSIDLKINNFNSNHPPYSYEWTRINSNGQELFATTEDVSNLSGLYTYCVKVYNSLCGEAELCIEFDPLAENEFYIGSFINSSDCSEEFGNLCDGFIEIENTLENLQFHEPITYSWSGPNSFASSSPNIYGLCPGNYSVTINTASGCSYVIPKHICCCESDLLEPSELECEETNQNLVFSYLVTNCTTQNSSDGAIDLTVGYNVSTPTFLWFNPDINPDQYFSTAEDVLNLIPGTYYVTVTDGCQQESAEIVVGSEACINQQGIPSLEISNYEVIPYFSEDNHLINSASINVDIYSEFGLLPNSLRWEKDGNYFSSSEDITNLEPGNYTIKVYDINSCEINKNFTIRECNNDLHVIYDYSETSYCWGGGSGDINVNIISGTAPFKASLYKVSEPITPNGFFRNLEFVSEVESATNDFTLTGVNGTAVYAIYIEDAFGECSTQMQFIPCQCDVFSFRAYTENACRGFLDFGTRRIVWDGIRQYGFSEFAEEDYYKSFLNPELLKFTITWHDGSTSIANLDGIIQGNDEFLPGSQGEFYVHMVDPFGCAYSEVYSFGVSGECLATGYDQLSDMLDILYGQGNPYTEIDDINVDVGCYVCDDYCGPTDHPLYCNTACLNDPLPDEDSYLFVVDEVTDPTNPCDGLKFYCPLDEESIITIAPNSTFFTEFINWGVTWRNERGECVHPCGCLYPLGSYPGQTSPTYIQTTIVVSDIECGQGDDTNSDPDPCLNDCVHVYSDPILNVEDDCLMQLTCLIPPCETILDIPPDQCFVKKEDGTCDLYLFCDHSNDVYWNQPIAINQPCLGNDGHISCFDVEERNDPLQDEEIIVRSSIKGDTISTDLKVLIFPNPATNILYYKITNASNLDISVTLFTTIGEVVKTFKANDIQGSIDLINIPPGMYKVVFQNDSYYYSSTFIKI